MSFYYYHVCHTCRKYGMLPKCPKGAASNHASALFPGCAGHDKTVMDENDIYGDDYPSDQPPYFVVVPSKVIGYQGVRVD